MKIGSNVRVCSCCCSRCILPRFEDNVKSEDYPNGPFPILEPGDQETGELDAVQERIATDFEASKL